MFAWFCADSFNCFRQGVSNNEYHLLFSSDSESTSLNFSLIEANSKDFNTNYNNYECSKINSKQSIAMKKTLDNYNLNKFNPFVQFYSKKYKNSNKKILYKAPSKKNIIFAKKKRKSLHQSFSIIGLKEKTKNKNAKNAVKNFCFQNLKNSLSKIDKILVCLFLFLFKNYLKFYFFSLFF